MASGLDIFITNKCNLACRYCPIEKDDQILPFSVFTQGLRQFISCWRSSPSCGISPDVTFSGGEPLLAWEVLQRGIRYIREFYPFLAVHIVTNGVFLDREKYNFLWEHNVRIGLSIDGFESTHNRQRPDCVGSSGSFNRIKENVELIPLEQRKEILVNMVITPQESSDLISRALFLRKLGFVRIGFAPQSQPWVWNERLLKKFGVAMKVFSNYYCELFLKEDNQQAFVIDSFQKASTAFRDGVFATKAKNCRRISLDFKGEFYSCCAMRTVSFRDHLGWKIGDIEKGIDLSARRERLSQLEKQYHQMALQLEGHNAGILFCPVPVYCLTKGFPGNETVEGAFQKQIALERIYADSFCYIFTSLKDNEYFRSLYGLKHKQQQSAHFKSLQ